MSVYVINPLADPRWNELVSRHPKASVFHQTGWLQALADTYGYQPRVVTCSPPGRPLGNGVAFCTVASWLTGTRLVSLPFSDHCDFLLAPDENGQQFSSWLKDECEQNKWSYVETRPRFGDTSCGLGEGRPFYFHRLDLGASLGDLFNRLHKDSIQRKVRRAEREGLVYDCGTTAQHVADFYRLLLITRRRHKLFPQPLSWFKNLAASMGDSIQIRLARRGTIAIAAMMTLRHKTSVVYKYGCSDDAQHHLGGMPFLFWKLIEESKCTSAIELDLGRCDMAHESLAVFKDRLGASRSILTYRRYENPKQARRSSLPQPGLMNRILPVLPDMVLGWGGRLLYRHMG